eukprot:602226-Rhodomonas_salina.1
MFFVEQTSREVKVLSVLDKPDGPGILEASLSLIFCHISPRCFLWECDRVCLSRSKCRGETWRRSCLGRCIWSRRGGCNAGKESDPGHPRRAWHPGAFSFTIIYALLRDGVCDLENFCLRKT